MITQHFLFWCFFYLSIILNLAQGIAKSALIARDWSVGMMTGRLAVLRTSWCWLRLRHLTSDWSWTTDEFSPHIPNIPDDMTLMTWERRWRVLLQAAALLTRQLGTGTSDIGCKL